MSKDYRETNCTRCKAPMMVSWLDEDEVHFCDVCSATLDAEIAEEEAEVNAMLEESDETPPVDLSLLDGVRTTAQILSDQGKYIAEDHKWHMDHPR